MNKTILSFILFKIPVESLKNCSKSLNEFWLEDFKEWVEE